METKTHVPATEGDGPKLAGAAPLSGHDADSRRVAGYCALCRAKEIELFGAVLSTTDERHARACAEAGCDHPAVYELDPPAVTDAVIERLRASMQEAETADHTFGKRMGRAWVCADRGGADYRSLRRLEKAFDPWDDSVFAEDEGDAFLASERVFYAINGDEYDRQDAKDFWDRFSPEEHPEVTFFKGFVEGALEAWDEVKARL